MRRSDSDEPRVLLDESSFEFSDVADKEIELGLDHLVDVVIELGADGLSVAKSSLIYEMECRDGTELHDLLFQEEASSLSRDVRQRAYITLDRMTNWDESVPSPSTLTPSIDGRDDGTLAPSVGHALDRATNGSAHAACLAFIGDIVRGFRKVKSEQVETQVFFFQDHGDLLLFWRGLFDLENVTEDQFFPIAHRAFPELILHHELSFRRFSGEYRDLREQVVRALTVLNDHFARVLQEHRGFRTAIQSELSILGLNCSPESPKTRSSSRLMALRDVEWQGENYRCEWHAKLDHTRNRIHFSLPSPLLEDRLLIGIFAEHLDT